MLRAFAAVCGLLLAADAIAANGDFDRLVDRFFDEVWFRYDPTSGTSAGFHQYDKQLEANSRQEIRDRIDALKKFEAAFEKLPGGTADRELVLTNIRAKLLSLEQIRMWERNPDIYSSGVTYSIFVIMSRKFAPAASRLESVIARERLIPRIFASARENLRNPPRIYTEIALEQLPGIIRFFQKDVPAAFTAVDDRKLLDDFKASNQGVIDTLTGYQQFLKNDLLPRSAGDFRIGAEQYSKQLLYEEMVDIPLDRLLEIGYQDLRRNQQALRDVAAKIDRNRKPHEILADLERDHPAPGNLLETFRNVLGGVREFIVQHSIVDVPSTVPPIVQETPPFARALTFASMDTPGPYESVAKEGFFNVTLPESDWSPSRIEEHMAGFHRGTVISTAIHEVYPGHYVQFLWVQKAPSKVRKLLGSNSNAEGWAHYCEQMMLDEGYANGDLKLRLGQIQDALLRNARYIVGISMHTGRMTFEQGVEFFVKEGYQTRANGERETKRGTSDPTYLVYTLGKLEILKLREDYRKQRGTQFTLRDFHDRFLGEGFPSLKMVRRALLGNDSPVL